MRTIFGKILLAASLISAPAALAEELFPGEDAQPADEIQSLDEIQPAESALWYGAWRCDAWPVMGPGLWYWVHVNGYVARNNAMSACQMNSGMACYFRCYRV